MSWSTNDFNIIIRQFLCFTLSKPHWLFNHFVIQTSKPTRGLDALSGLTLGQLSPDPTPLNSGKVTPLHGWPPATTLGLCDRSWLGFKWRHKWGERRNSALGFVSIRLVRQFCYAEKCSLPLISDGLLTEHWSGLGPGGQRKFRPKPSMCFLIAARARPDRTGITHLDIFWLKEILSFFVFLETWISLFN
jgi:hypothetical protein